MDSIPKMIEYIDLNRKMVISTYNTITQNAPLDDNWRVVLSEEDAMKIRELLTVTYDMINETYYFFFPDENQC